MFKLSSAQSVTWQEQRAVTRAIDTIDIGAITISPATNTLTAELWHRLPDTREIVKKTTIVINGEAKFNAVLAANPVLAATLRKIALKVGQYYDEVADVAAVDQVFGDVALPVSLPAAYFPPKPTAS